ncbi:MAG: metal-dependent transcriptional regulator [bacterium JZ-2024 1]
MSGRKTPESPRTLAGAATRAAQDCVKAIYRIGEHGDKVTTKRIAEVLKVSAPTVTQMLKRMAGDGWVKYERYRGVTLTEAGEKVALEMLRHHRLVEQFLHQVLGMPWDKVHDEAERWEHILSEEVEARMAEALEHPRRDPHGARIPPENLDMEREPLATLADLEPGSSATIVELGDHDANLLRYFARLALFPDTQVTVAAREPFGGSIAIIVEGQRKRVSPGAAAYIRIRKT